MSVRIGWGVLIALLVLGGAAWGQVAGPSQMGQCDQGTFTVTVENASPSASACSIVIAATPPEIGFSYVPGSAVLTLDDGTPFSQNPIDNAWNVDAIVGSAYELPPGGTLTVQFDLATDCSAVSGNVEVVTDYVDCATGDPYEDAGSMSIEVLPGAVTISKTPSVIEAGVGDQVPWTITVESTGLGSVRNVVVTDTLGPGLAFVSGSGGVSAIGQTVTWDSSSVPALSEIASGESVLIEVMVEVMACQGLVNTADAVWGCSSGPVCFDTSVSGPGGIGTAEASVSLLVKTPFLAFPAPALVVPYCADRTQCTIPITNSGEGWARSVTLCCSFPGLDVENVQGGATHSGGCFAIPDIAPGTTFDLTFEVAYAGVWCSGGPSGTSILQLSYENDCGIPYLATPQFGSISSGAGPSLSVNKTGPATLRLGETASYDISVAYVGSQSCGGATPGPITVVDTYPEGFTLLDPAGGIVNPAAGTITWSFDPVLDPPFAKTVTLEAPSDCAACAGPGGGTAPNTVTAAGTDCCGCPISAQASAPTTIQCEGVGDGIAYYSSSISLSTGTVLRCVTPAILTVTHTYTFDNNPALDDLSADEFTYFVNGDGDLQYEPGTAFVLGAPLGAVNDLTPNGRLELTLSDGTTVRGRTIVFSYDLRVLGLDDPSCLATSYPIHAGIEVAPGATAIGFCSTMYGDAAAPPSVTAQPPAMSVAITGVPTVQDDCGTYPVTITLTRTSGLAIPYDVRLVLTNSGGSLIDLAQAQCAGVSPTDGTTCTSPIVDGDTMEWRFGDGFAAADTATITVSVTVPCGGPLAELSAVASFDDLCNHDGTYNNSCSTSASAKASLRLEGKLWLELRPEKIYATGRSVTWKIQIQNTFNGTAHGVYVDSVLGSGLEYTSSVVVPATGVTTFPGQSHTGAPINGASWSIDAMAPGEKREITLIVKLVDCTNLTNTVSTGFGCGGDECQPPSTKSSLVVVPPSNLVATSYSPTPVDKCSTSPATVTAKNAGVTTVYNVSASVTLPTGLSYAGNPQYRIGTGAWLAAGEPSGAPGPALVWTPNEIPALAEVAPKQIVEIRFDMAVGCDFPNGQLSFQASYENPCGSPNLSNVGLFTVLTRVPNVVVEIEQIAPNGAIPCGGSAQWEIRVRNTGQASAPFVRVVSTLDSGWTYSTSTDGGVNGGGSVTTWEIADLSPSELVTLTITADSAVGGGACAALGHIVEASWACSPADGQCLGTVAASDFVAATRTPPVSVNTTLVPSSIEACSDTTQFTLSITNSSLTAAANYIDARVTLPAGITYVPGTTEIDCGLAFAPAADPSVNGQTLTWYNIALQGDGSDTCAVLEPGGLIRVRFDATSSCYFATQNAAVDVYFYDCCGIEQQHASSTAAIASLLPHLTITKTPSETTLDCFDAGDTATWTVTVLNTGPGRADWVRLEDVLGPRLVLDSSSSAAGPGVSMGGQKTGWEIGPLASGASFVATITAHLLPPANDCSAALRTNTASAAWGCGTFDGDPNTGGGTCVWPTPTSTSAVVRAPNLAIGSGDITPVFACTADGIAPGSGEIRLVVRNTGDGAVSEDFSIALTETTTALSVTGTFTSLGGVLPLAAGASQTLVFADWAVTCGSCAYQIQATLDTSNAVCECRENDNQATLSTTITIPDLVIASADLAVTCSADGQIRIQGPLTLRNDGCGDPLTGTVRLRFRIYDGSDCNGAELQTFTLNLTGLSIPSGGGTATRGIDVTRTLNTCGICQISIRIEADDNNAICECNGLNNGLCAGTFSTALPDLTVTDIDFGQVVCSADRMSGNVRVTITNNGCGAAGAFAVRLASSGCLAFSDQTVAGLGAGASTTVSFPLSGDWADCATCTCTLTATVDPASAVCECSGANNVLSEPYASSLPDLQISGAVPAIGCASDGQASVSASLTLANTGCGPATGLSLRVTLYDGTECTGAVVDTWTENLPGLTLPAGDLITVELTPHSISPSLCGGDCGYSARFEVDPDDTICECDGENNGFCVSSVPSLLPDLVVTEIDPSVDCVAGSARVEATVRNVGCGDATGVGVRLTSDGCGLSVDSPTIDVPAGASRNVIFSFTPNCDSWNCAFTVTADAGQVICECSGANALTIEPYPGEGSIGDRVWFDFNGDGVQDVGEDGIPGATIVLEADLDGDGVIDYAATTTTDAGGEYLFQGLPAGNYTLSVEPGTLPDGLTQTYDFDGLGSPDASGYTLALNEHQRDQDFGYRGRGSIGDRVWYDANGDGVQDPGEDGMEGVTVTLEGDLDGDGVVETRTTVTGADGVYLFEYLPAGPYTLSVDAGTLPAGLEQTHDYDGLGTADRSDYTLGAGEHDRRQDFGYASPALSVDKTIADVLRSGSSLGTSGPVQPGDIIVYRFVIENVGPVPAYGVGFSDSLPAGVEIDTSGGSGSYTVTDPPANGSLGLSDGATAFTAPIHVTVNAGAIVTTTSRAVVTSAVEQGTDLVNTASAFGLSKDGTPIPTENPSLGDTSDADVEDPDADDTGIAIVGVVQPALSVDKTITDIRRDGSSIGTVGPVEPGDIVSYRFVIRNVGGGIAYNVDFADVLPNGLEIELGSAGTYFVTAPAASGSLGLTGGQTAFTTSIDATLDGGGTLTADFTALVGSGIEQGLDLVNTAEATGYDGFGTQIPDQNPAAGDTSDDDVEDPDADDTGIARIGAEKPALSVDKTVFDIVRRGASIGTNGPVEPGDVVFYLFTIANVGLGTAYDVGFSDTLPSGLVIETAVPGSAGTFTVSEPAASGSLGLSDGATGFTIAIGATISGGGQLEARYSTLATSEIQQGIDLINAAAATGKDGAGNQIPKANPDIGDLSDNDAEDPDADDTGIAILGTREPALSVDKRVTNVFRGGSAIGITDPVLYGDVIEYTTTIRNVGAGTAYGVDFSENLPFGLEVETQTPGNAGTYHITAPAATGGLSLPDGASTFATALDAILAGGASLSATYTVLVTPSAPPAIELVNAASAIGFDGAGTQIPASNEAIGDTADDDLEDPDADDTGTASVRVGAPALVTEKSVERILRNETAVPIDHVEPGDRVTYRLVVRNVGQGPALGVQVADLLPPGFEYAGSVSAEWPGGSSAAAPSGAPGPNLSWTLGASLDSGEVLTLRFDVRVTSQIHQGDIYTNTMSATGRDAAGVPIPPDNRKVVPEDTDPDDASAVGLVGAEPALVTGKRVIDVLRGGQSLGAAATVETGDVIVFELIVRNVGLGSAYAVDVRDELPTGFAYQNGTTQATWPYGVGTYTANPLAAPGPSLLWNPAAQLAAGESLSLRFRATVVGTVAPGVLYTNVLIGTGRDGANETIPPNNASDVPNDTDLDDRDSVTLIGAADVPALVTSKTVSEIRRNGMRVRDSRIERGDVITFEIAVTNVGPATAYAVGLTDELPAEFRYIPGSTIAVLPLTVSTSDPLTRADRLAWNLGATLATGERIELTFQAAIEDPLYDGRAYTNRMSADGRDGSGTPIPTDQRTAVAADNDSDDASSVSLIARSDLFEGGGGLINVPILRKEAEVLGAGSCEAATASVDRLWFQTDIALYAATEFTRLRPILSGGALDPVTFLPTWIRTVGQELAVYALDNLLQVNVLSSIGVPLAEGPRLRALAEASGVSLERALADRLDALADAAGFGTGDRPSATDWVFLEYAGGEPLYFEQGNTPWGTRGRWTERDEGIVASALGMGLLKGAETASSLLSSTEARDRYIGWVLAESMANKLDALRNNLSQAAVDGTTYIPHRHRWIDAGFALEDAASTLLDQAALLWGAAMTLDLVDRADANGLGRDPGLVDALRTGARWLLETAAQTIDARHVDSQGRCLSIAPADGSNQVSVASTVELSMLLVAIDAALGHSTESRLTLIQARAIPQLLARQGADGGFESVLPTAGAQTSELTAQLAGIRGLLAVGDVARANRAFDALEELWEDRGRIGWYRSGSSVEPGASSCYTPLDMGLAVGALQELAQLSQAERQGVILTRLAGFVRTVVDDAALQLSNARNPQEEAFIAGGGRGVVLGLAAAHPAPVLQQRLCWRDGTDGTSCGGWRPLPHDPWYQTDVAMYASFAIQDRVSEIEDYSDANLAAVVFHSGLGVALDAIPALDSISQPRGSLSPMALPYYAGDPTLSTEGTLGWNASTFDTRIVPSALGMTLLRESQELAQLLAVAARSDLETTEARLLLASILGNLSGLEALTLDGPGGIQYVPHASLWEPGSAPRTEDARSTLLDQLSLLLGLTGSLELLEDAEMPELLSSLAAEHRNWSGLVETLLQNVLDTLEVAHLARTQGVLVETAQPVDALWIRDGIVSATNLGLICEALEGLARIIDPASAWGPRALTLLAGEVNFLVAEMWDGTGGYRERWALGGEDSLASCSSPTLTGQLGAVRALLAAHRLLQWDADWVRTAFRAFDARFWSPVLEVYTSSLDSFTWCVTPLDLAVAVEVIAQAAAFLDPDAERQALWRLGRHLDHVLDAIDLQLPSWIEEADGVAGARQSRTYAPVFDRRICVEPSLPMMGSDWTHAGDVVRYTVTVENSTDETFSDLVLDDLLPEGVTLQSADPAGEVTERDLRWRFARLAPEEVRTWTLLVRVDRDRPLGEVLDNCATLHYLLPSGDEGPPREACASIVLQTLDDARGEELLALRLLYRTDAAMRLSVALEESASEDWSEDDVGQVAHEVSLANLGILLGESGLGVPLSAAPEFLASNQAESELQARFDRLAREAVLPGTPRVSLPVFLPYDTGTPVLEKGFGFIEKSGTITPAALGWTLAREAQLLGDLEDSGALEPYFRGWVKGVLDSQLVWLSEAMRLGQGEGPFLPHGIRTAIVSNAVSYGVSDPSSTLYDQAALLLGLLRIASVKGLDARFIRTAEQLASETFSELERHWDGATRTLSDTLEGQAAAPRWSEVSVAARALTEVVQRLPQSRSAAEGMLDGVGRLALDEKTSLAPTEEAARICVLLIASRSLASEPLRSAGLDAWAEFEATAYDESTGTLSLSVLHRAGWAHTPSELAVAIEMLREVASTDPNIAGIVGAIGAQLVRESVIFDRVQLRQAPGYWEDSVYVPCLDLAPVLATWFGSIR